jgi:hypothetical protein
MRKSQAIIKKMSKTTIEVYDIDDKLLYSLDLNTGKINYATT